MNDRHSTTGNLFMMSGAAIDWLSKKQPVVALSTTEAEYMALSSATCTQEAVWLSSKPEPIMLSVLPIIPSRISHNCYPSFLFYSHAIAYYSCYIL